MLKKTLNFCFLIGFRFCVNAVWSCCHSVEVFHQSVCHTIKLPAGLNVGATIRGLCITQINLLTQIFAFYSRRPYALIEMWEKLSYMLFLLLNNNNNNSVEHVVWLSIQHIYVEHSLESRCSLLACKFGQFKGSIIF